MCKFVLFISKSNPAARRCSSKQVVVVFLAEEAGAGVLLEDRPSAVLLVSLILSWRLRSAGVTRRTSLNFMGSLGRPSLSLTRMPPW